MVNKIDGNNYYDYQKLKNVNIPDTGEKFSLDYKQGELQSKPKDDKDKEADNASIEQDQTADKNGVKLELSRQGQSAASGRKKSDNASSVQDILGVQSIIDSIREFVSTAITAVKDFFYNLWYDTPRPEADMQVPEENSDFKDTLESVNSAGSESSSEHMETDDFSNLDARTTYRMNNEKLDRRIQPYLKSGDLNNVMNLLTDNGRKSIAMNSNLLTHYDRNGKMVEPNASDRERILHGDVNTRKL